MRFTLIDPSHPFYAPLWRRVVIVVVTLGWAAVEFATGNLTWGILVGALGAYCLFKLILTFDPAGAGDSD
ncbi:hypothetical protein CLV78_103226 [Aliiruegeria haliotis]|uniref:DUF3329 domain-containing protein n=1 Tax=Aliiruegeria haliotis TaxID=1280846 RepID=A0A2T0RTC6_9RHOB|nr:hypothetical protein [Aliiruegeria haliotis]PRY24360.1 hypothetical protein CLV78_103226 [Aliiruegeria haliotis]